MRNSTPRQKHLYLVAKLYELAAEFSDEELRAIKLNLTRAGEDPGILRAVDALIRLHGAVEKTLPLDLPSPIIERKHYGASLRLTPETESFVRIEYPRIDSPVELPTSGQSIGNSRDMLTARSLGELFENREIFPKVKDISDVVPGGFEPQHKESRSRYVKRVSKFVAGLDRIRKSAFKAALSKRLEKQSGGFISQWKNLIREL